MYVSKPVQKVLGYFEVSCIHEDSPKKLWARYSAIGGILKEEFQAYYSSFSRGIAIGIGNVYTLRNPVPLYTLDKSLLAPQGFIYLNTEIFQIIQGLTHQKLKREIMQTSATTSCIEQRETWHCPPHR
jgi:hypothetical protein